MSGFNLRKRTRISYYEPEEPNLDEYIFCSDCGDFVYEYCAIHGPLLVIPDDKVPSKSPYPPSVPRSALTIPHVFLHLAPSIIPGAGIGVFSTLTLPRGVRFGPYRGSKTYEVSSTYCWQIHDGNNKRSHFVDAEDANNSNWMRYVNCSRHWTEQNLVAYQYRGMVYYRTIKIIPKFTELLVFYGGEFAHMLQINIKKYNSRIGYVQKLGAPNLQKVPLVKEKPNETFKDDKANSYEQPEVKDAKKLKKTNQKKEESVVSKTINLDKPNKLNEDEMKFPNKKYKNKKTNYEPPKKKQVSSSSKSINDKTLKGTKIREHFRKDDQNKEFTNIETKLVTELNVEVNKKRSESNFLIPNNNFICDICNYKTNVKKHLISHIGLHDKGRKIYSCNYCKYITNVKGSLCSHIKIHTGSRSYTCHICHKKFTHSNHLKSHIRIHTGEKPFECYICHKKFTQSNHLKCHIRIHTGEKPFECHICHKKFTQGNYLKSHIRIHTGEKPFECYICHKKFTYSEVLKSHISSHTGVRPFECHICHKKFTYSNVLKSHISSHTGVRPFECHICHKKFTRSDVLKSHIRIHTGEKPFECCICHKKFTQSSSLNTHIRTHAK